jgi:sec-independent protein translocase protein TatB
VFDVGLGEILLLLLAALFVFGPDRLPTVVGQASRLIRQLREMAAGARNELSDAIGPELRELDLTKQLGLHELDPRRALDRLLADGDAAPTQAANGNGHAAANGAQGTSAAADGTPARSPEHPSYDPDAT